MNSFCTMNVYKIPLNVLSKGIKPAYVRRTRYEWNAESYRPKLNESIELMSFLASSKATTTMSLENIHQLLKLSMLMSDSKY